MSYIGNTATQQAFTPAVDFFNGNGSTVAFTLSRPVASVAQVQAVVENVPQNPGDAYTVSGNTITFTSAPPSGTQNVYVYYTSPITQVIAPGQGTVGPTALTAGAPSWSPSGGVTLPRIDSTNEGGQLNLNRSSDDTNAWALDVYGSGTATAMRVIDVANGVEIMRWNQSGSIPLRGASTSANGVGITFPASQSASTDANTLDDYEEGTWTPTFKGSTTDPTVTYGFQVGSYVKIGRLVYATCRISCTSVSGGSGQLFVYGLPFNPTGNHAYFGGGSLTYRAGWATSAPNLLRIFASPLVELYVMTATGESNITPSNLQSGTDLIINCLYQTAG